MNTKESVAGLPAELIVAGKMAAVGWNIYSPHRDLGIDFIATKQIDSKLLIRPVQVKGCYLQKKKDTRYYGRTKMELKQWDDEMILAMPFFFPDAGDKLSLQFIAYLPTSQLRRMNGGGYRAQPCRVSNGRPEKREGFTHFFDDEGLSALDAPDWKLTPTKGTERQHAPA